MENIQVTRIYVSISLQEAVELWLEDHRQLLVQSRVFYDCMGDKVQLTAASSSVCFRPNNHYFKLEERKTCTRTRWLNVYANYEVIYMDKNTADEGAGKGRINCIPIEYTFEIKE